MHRNDDWLPKLNRFIAESRNKPFEWGTWDCCMFAAEAVKVMTGEDLAKDLRGKYTDARGAAEQLRATGSGSLYNLMRRHFGDPVSPSHAWRGDIVYNRKCLGIAYGQVAIFVGGYIGPEIDEGQLLPGLTGDKLLDMQAVFRIR